MMIDYDNLTDNHYYGPAPENLTYLMTNCTGMGCSRVRQAPTPSLHQHSELPPYIRIAATTVCAVILTLGTAGNILVATVVWRTKELRNSTNLFLINLSMADLLVLLVCVPPVLVELHSMPEIWLLGEGMFVMADQEQRGLMLIAEAEKKLKSAQGFFGALFGGSNKIEDACELYHQAANAFKMAKKWTASGNAYCEAAELHIKSGSRHDAASAYVDAGNCYKKTDPQEAISCLMKAVELYTDMGRFTIAAKHLISVAELYEVNDIEKAISCYEQAADYYRGEESNSSANKCLLSVAKYSAQLEQYEKAIEIYEQVASSALESSLLKYSAKEYFFRAGLCHLCVDLLNAQHALAKYEELSPSFCDSRECKLLKELIEKVEDQDVDGFTDAVKTYDSISRLDQWYTTILLRIKKAVQDTPDLC